MRNLTRMVCLFVLLCPLAAAGDGRWYRRIATAAACAASAYDVWSTRYAVDRGAIEANPLASRGGQVRWGRAGALKAGICAASWVAGEFHLFDRRDPVRSNRLATASQSGIAGAFLYFGVHNQRLGDRLPSRPSYLLQPAGGRPPAQ